MYIFLMLKVLPQKASDELGWDVVMASSTGLVLVGVGVVLPPLISEA
jgi:hypothetical protein